MPVTVVRTHCRRKRRRRVLPYILIVLLSLALCFAAVYYVGIYLCQVEEATYSLEYEDFIRENAEVFSLDPARVAAVIYCESNFHPKALSSVGAMGLMQIMPSTGKWIAKKLGDDNYSVDRLYDPQTNIRYGCWYLNYLNGRFDSDLTKTTAAYHSGCRQVDEWLKNPANSSDGVTLESIPSEITAKYVNRVGQALEKYKEIMEK